MADGAVVHRCANTTGIAVAPNGATVDVPHLFSIDLMVIDAAADALAPSRTMFLQHLRGGSAAER